MLFCIGISDYLIEFTHFQWYFVAMVIDTDNIFVCIHTLRDRSRVVPRSDRACVFTERFLRSENAGFTKSRRVIAKTMLHTPCWVCNDWSRTAGAAEGISGRLIFAACWARMPIKAFAKIATPRLFYDSKKLKALNGFWGVTQVFGTLLNLKLTITR